jgi:hypothetical protein
LSKHRFGGPNAKADFDALFEALLRWQDVIHGHLDKAHDAVGILREKVAMLEGQQKAMIDLKGIPGKLGEAGKQGPTGDAGPPGEAGKPGASAPHWIGVKIDGFDLVTVMSDGTIGPRISLEKMFGEFARHMMVGT